MPLQTNSVLDQLGITLTEVLRERGWDPRVSIRESLGAEGLEIRVDAQARRVLRTVVHPHELASVQSATLDHVVDRVRRGFPDLEERGPLQRLAEEERSRLGQFIRYEPDFTPRGWEPQQAPLLPPTITKSPKQKAVQIKPPPPKSRLDRLLDDEPEDAA